MSNFELQSKTPSSSSPNKSQKKATVHKNGPLMVVAGAGTGKTRVITERIAFLIQNKLAKPEEILALTFTEKAASEMEVRVDQLLPYGLTNTNIFTFHGFCDSLLREFAMEADLTSEFKILTAKESELLLHDRISEIEGVTELSPTKNHTKYVRDILRVISRAKDELIDCEDYALRASKLSTSNTIDEREITKQKEIALIYSAYENWKQEIGAQDFGDLISTLISTLKNNPLIQKTLQNRFKFILIDEFQDTNKAQYELVKMLLCPKQNLTVVGDDDQSIYAFRGASINNILGFMEDFPKTKVVALTENYRSTQTILDLSYDLIQGNNPHRLEEKLQISKKLNAQNKGNVATFHWYQADTDELASLSKKIKERAKQINYRDIAILVRSNASAEAITQTLGLEEIPYITNFDNSFSTRPEIRAVVAFFRVIKNPNDSESLMKLALSPFYNIPVTDFLHILDNAKTTHKEIDEILRNKEESVWKLIPDTSRKLLIKMKDELDSLRELLKTKNAGEILYEFLEQREFLKKEKLDTENYTEMLQNIMVVFTIIKNWIDIGGNPFATHFIDEMELILKDIAPPNFDESNDYDAVQVMTIHSSKGLEFDTVFLPMMVSDRFPARMRRNTLNLLDLEQQNPDEHLQEERRLAYVALTRAKKNLFLSGSQFVGAGARAKKPSRFVMEALNLEHIPSPITVDKTTSALAHFSPKKPIKTTLRYPSFDGVITLSPSMIESYLKCPYEFYWRYVLKAPLKPNHNLVYGSAIHAGIEAFFKAKSNKEKQALKAFEKLWREDGFPDAKTRKTLKQNGIITLKNFIQKSKNEPQPTEIERSFTLNLGEAKIKGRIDAFYDNPLEIKDFKTSLVKDEKDATKKLRANFPLKVYALAITENLGQIPEKLSLDFVDASMTVSYQPKEKDLDKVREKIQMVIEKVKAGEFEPNPSEHFCDVCGKI